MVKLDRIEHTVQLVEGVSAAVDGDLITITGPKGNLSREFVSPRHSIFHEGDTLRVSIDLPRRKERALAGTWNAHLNKL